LLRGYDRESKLTYVCQGTAFNINRWYGDVMSKLKRPDWVINTARIVQDYYNEDKKLYLDISRAECKGN
jgi:hypothetical protein